MAQDSGAGRSTSVVPVFSLSQTVTDNVDLSSTNRRADAITQLSPGIRISSQAGRIRGSLDYTLNALVYARDQNRSEIQNALSSAFVAEVVENHFSVDARASISRQSISAFGVQSAGTTSSNSNSTEVRTLSVTPVLRGNIAGVAEAQARLVFSKTSGQATATGDSTTTGLVAGLAGRQGLFGWSADVSELTNEFSGGRKTKQGSATLGLNYVPDVDWRLSARLGRESNDVLSIEREVTSTWGVGADWSPSPRTQLSARKDHRYFGDSHSLTFQHRMARTVFRLADVRDSSSDLAGEGSLNAVTAYENLSAQLARIEPDPIRRDVLVRSILAQSGGFLTSGVSLSRRQDASVAFQGLRSSAVIGLSRSDTRRLGAAAPGGGDLSRTDRVKQSTYSLTLGHRLDPTTSASVTAALLRTADSGTLPGNDQKSVNFSLSNQFGQRTFVSLTLRHVTFDSASGPYTENAAIATLSLQF